MAEEAGQAQEVTGVRQRIVIEGDLDRHALEAALLEIRRLGRRRGFTLTSVRVETRGAAAQTRPSRRRRASSSA
jgi:hypothetical protein